MPEYMEVKNVRVRPRRCNRRIEEIPRRLRTPTFSGEAVEGWVACGPPEQCVEQLQGFVDAGASDILLRSPSWDQQTQFRTCVEEVLPHLT